MKKRIARKILMNLWRYTMDWAKPDVNYVLTTPKDGRSWYLIRKASYKMHKPHVIKIFEDDFKNFVGHEEL